MSNEGKEYNPKATWDASDIEMEKLGQRPLASFDCGRAEQNQYFQKYAEHDQKHGVSVTYLLLIKGKQAGFVTITMDEIQLAWKKEIPGGVRFSRLPAVKLAQMGVDKNYAGQGLGQVLVTFAIRKAKELSSEVGCRFVTLDAKADLVQWYAYQGFRENEKDNVDRLAEAEEREKAKAKAENREPREIVLPVSMRIDLHTI